MGRTIYTNNTDRIVYLGGRSVFPGATREVDERDLPEARSAGPAPVAPEPTFDEAIETLLAQRVPEIRKVLHELEGDLGPLLIAEQAGRNRRSVIEAIEAQRLARATEETIDD